MQVFHIKRSRTIRKICEVTLLCGSDNSSTYLPHLFNLPYVIHTWAINNGNRTEWSPIRSVTIRKTAQRESDLLIISMITDRIGRLEFLFTIS